jgi:Mg2+-importing ATPase
MDPEMNLASAEKLRKASNQDIEKVYDMLDSSAEGISEEAARDRISTYGLNEVDYDRAPAWYIQLIKSFINPFILILVAIVAISFAEGSMNGCNFNRMASTGINM